MARAGGPTSNAWDSWSAQTLSSARGANTRLLVRATAFWCGDSMEEPGPSPAKAPAGATGLMRVEADVGRYPEVLDLLAADDLPAVGLLDALGTLVGGPLPDTPAARAALARGRVLPPSPQALAESLTVEGMAGGLLAQFDWTSYAVGPQAHCPQPECALFLLRAGLRTGDEGAVKAATLLLDAMHKSEVNDTVDGGFFCRARAPKWKESVTGKSLAMNAQMATAYAVAGKALGRPDFERVARDTLRYVNRFLSQGESQLWWNSQAPDDDYYGRLQHRRSAGDRPALERFKFADSCACAISALAIASLCSGEAEFEARAKLALEELYEEAGGRDPPVFHCFEGGQWQGESFLRDTLGLLQAMLDVWCATGDERWLEGAAGTAEGVLPLANETSLSLFERSVLGFNLLRLAAAGGSAPFQLGGRTALRVIPQGRFESRAARTAWGTALIAQRHGVIVIAGEPSSPLTREALALSLALGPAVLSKVATQSLTVACGGQDPVEVGSMRDLKLALAAMSLAPPS